MLPNRSNTNQAGCTPVASNCVIWTGGNIPCIQLCTGDSISDVTAKLAQQLCYLLDQVNISNFSTALLCFDPVCPSPKNLTDIINFIINQLCLLQAQQNASSGTGANGCPNCVVTVAPCFYTTNSSGDVITTMQLTDYARAIGVQVCGILTSITAINATLVAYNTRITALENRVITPYTPPLVPSTCLSATSTDIVSAIVLVTSSFCALQAATGTPANILAASAVPCSNLAQSPSLALPSSTMGSIPGWDLTVTSLADSFNNAWLTICDLRAAVANLANCCNQGCNDVIVNMIATFASGVITVNFTGTVPAGYVDCSPTGNPLLITDGNGNSQTVTVPVVSSINNNTPVTITLNSYMSLTTNYNLLLLGCWTNPSTGLTCERQILYTLVNSTSCPAVTYTPTVNSISYSFTSPAAISIAGNITVEIWTTTGSSPLATNIINGPIASGDPLAGTFSGLTNNTSYLLRVIVNTTGTNPINCPFSTVATLGEGIWVQSGNDGSPLTEVFFGQPDGSNWLLGY